jgi:MFS transporter, putative metabolite:H+ symporter
MLEALDERDTLSGNQRKIVLAAMVSTALEYFDYFVIGFVMAFVVTPWKLTFGEMAVILTSSGIGTTLGSFFWGNMADRIGRRPVLIATVLVFSMATGALALTPERGWIYLAVFRFLVGFGVGGLFSVQLPFVQEFMPARKKGQMAGLVTSFVSVGIIAGAVSGAFLTPFIGWRGLFALGMLPAVLALVFLFWVKESPYWLLSRGRAEEARTSLAWALECRPDSLTKLEYRPAAPKARFVELFRHPRGLLASWLSQLGYQMGASGVLLWAPTLLALQLAIPASSAAKLMITVTIAGLAGRLLFSWAAERAGRRPLGLIVGIGAASALLLGAFFHSAMIGGISLLWISLIIWAIFGDGGYAIVGPYAAEVWPSRIRATGMGSAYGFGGIGKIVGPLVLALIIGSVDVISPKASMDAILPGFGFYAACYLLSGLAFLIGFETRGLSLADVDARDSLSVKVSA